MNKQVPFYRQFLILRLSSLKLVNPRYSMRALAGRIGLHPSALSRILSGRSPIAVKSALRAFGKLDMTTIEREEVFASVLGEHLCLENNRYRKSFGLAPGGAITEASLNSCIAWISKYKT